MLNTIQEIINFNDSSSDINFKVIENISKYLSEFFKDKEPLIAIIKEYETDNLLDIKVISEELDKERYKDFFKEHTLLPEYKSFNNKGTTYLGKYTKIKKEELKNYLKDELNLDEKEIDKILSKLETKEGKEKNSKTKSKKKDNSEVFLIEVYEVNEKLLLDLQKIIISKIKTKKISKICPFCKKVKDLFTEDTNRIIDVYNITNKFFFPFWEERKLLICVDCFLTLYAYYPLLGFLVNWKSRNFYSLKLKFFPFKTKSLNQLEKLLDNLNNSNIDEKTIFRGINKTFENPSGILIDLYFYYTDNKSVKIIRNIENIELKNILEIWNLLAEIEESLFFKLFNEINSKRKKVNNLVLFDKSDNKERINILDALYSNYYKEESKKFIFEVLTKVLTRKSIDFNRLLRFFNISQSYLSLKYSPKEFIKKFLQFLILIEFLEKYYKVRFIKTLKDIRKMDLKPEYYFAYVVGILLARLDKKMKNEGKKELGQKILAKSNLDLKELEKVFNKIMERIKIYNVYVNDLNLPEVNKITFNKEIDKDLLKFYLSYGYLYEFTHKNINRN
ncbi:MAG: hypothetical protein ABGW69_03245 [Nanoarchaeota archaeon]